MFMHCDGKLWKYPNREEEMYEVHFFNLMNPFHIDLDDYAIK